MAFTPSQLAAVEHTGNLVMFAGPGSGKTSTSIEKVTRNLMQGTDQTQLMTTFTRESAGEMRNRLNQNFEKLGHPLVSEDRLRICTFDSLTLWHLRGHLNGKLNLLNPVAQMPRLFQLCTELGIGRYDEHARWFDAYQSVINREALLEQIEAESRNSLKLIDAYYEWMKSAGLMDLATVKRTVAVQMHAGVMSLLPFNNMLVDEAQDCDELQILIATTMGQNGCRTTLVGDDDQTIYDWRCAAGYKGMIKFREDATADVVRLAENFRSKAEIVEASTNLIRFNNPNRVEKNQVAIKGEGGQITVASFDDIFAQAKWIASEIARTTAPPRDVAILSRTNLNLDAAESACKIYGIPFHRVGSSLWERDDISAFTAMLTFMLSGGGDMLSQCMGLLGFSRHTINSLLKEMSSTQLSFRRGNSIEINGASPDEQAVINDMSCCFGKWRLDVKDMAYEIVIGESVIAFANWYSSLGAQAKRDGRDHPKVTRLKSGLEHVERVLLSIDGHIKSRVRFLRQSKKNEPEPGVVRLMTMHGSKGLEWNDVYLLGADEGEDDSSVSQGPAERRVFFVGMTRARNRLTIAYSGKFPLFLAEAYINRSSVLINPKPSQVTTVAPAAEGDGDADSDAE